MNRQQLFYILGLILGLGILVVSQMPDGKARMIACDVGQGDAILITQGKVQILVDGGPSGEKILSCLARWTPFWDRKIELIVLTNTDYDHMNGLSTVMERYIYDEFVTADGVHESEALERFANVRSETDHSIVGVEQGEIIRVGNSPQIEFRVLWPPEVIDEYLAVFSNQITNTEREQILGASAKRGELNERSVVALVTVNGYKILLTGDAGDQAEIALIANGMLSDVDLLKVGHHGSKYASTSEFLNQIRPEKAVISVGSKNRYGHPTQETLSRLVQVGADIMRTDQVGDVEYILEK